MSIHRTAQETSGQENLVSVIMPFLDTEQFIEEAIQSVLNQTHSEWEPLLIDDGSRDGSTQIAQDYQQEQPGKIRYFTHPDGETHGASAARNVGIWQARGEYIALLDSDDVWSAEQLSQQVETLRAIPEADMVYGNTLSWYSWTKRPEDEERDAVPDLGISSDTLYAPPEILSLHLRRRASVPCTCSMLIRRSLVEQAGGFEEEFRYIFTDQVFYAKLFTCGTVYVVDENWGKYRRHSRSSVSLVEQRRAIPAAEFRYLEWLEQYLRKTGINDRKLWRALRGAIRPYRHPLMHRLVARKQVFLASLAAALSYGVRWFRSQPRGIITAHSNPILSSSPDGLAATNLSWKFRGAAEVEVRIDAADGPLFARTGGDAEKETGEWVQDGTVFYLQNVSHGIPLTRHHTLATVRVHFLPQIEIRPLPSAKPALDGDWYDEELGAVGMERFLAGNYLKRNQALAKWILDSGVKRVFDFAVGGAGLAKILEERTDYLWSDFAAVPAKAAKNLLSRASIEQIDITKEYENVPWGKYDGVVCVSIEHLVNDLDILSAVRAGTQVFLSCATFDDASHVRFFSGEQSVRARFSPLLEIRRLERVADKIIVQGVRKPWRYSQDKLTGMFRANHYSYLQEQDELYRYVAGHLSGRVLDVGCWNGLLYPYLNCSDYVGIDLCKEAIEEARSRYAGEFHVSDWEAFQYPGHFDSIYLGGVLFYQSDKKGFVRSWERYQPRRIVVQDLEETRVELDYRLVASKQFQLSVEKPDNIVRRAVYIYDVA